MRKGEPTGSVNCDELGSQGTLQSCHCELDTIRKIAEGYSAGVLAHFQEAIL